MELDDNDKSRCRFHLGFGTSYAGIDAGDAAQIEESMQDIKDEYMLRRVLEQLDICDQAWESAKATKTGFRYDLRETYAGDINRTILRDSAKSLRIWEENYLRESDALAKLLWVPNYHRPEMMRYRFERAAAAFVKSIPGPADTAVSSRRLEYKELAGNFGF